MSPRRHVLSLVLVPALAAVALAAPLGSAFTYQGQLKQTGSAVSATVDMRFSLWDASTAGSLAGSPNTITFDGAGGNPASVVVTGGLFTVQLDFGAAAFNGQARYLQIEIRKPAGVGGYALLSARQLLTIAPNTQFAQVVADASINNAKLASDGASLNKVSAGEMTADTVNHRVGIGVASPAAALDVAGNIQLADVNTNAPNIVFRGNGEVGADTGVGHAGDGVLTLWTNALERARLDGSGNLLLGRSSGSFRLDASGGANGSVARFESTATDFTLAAISNTSVGGKNYSLLSTGSAHAAGVGKFIIRDVSAAQDRLALDGSGNLVVGSTTLVAGIRFQAVNASNPVALFDRTGNDGVIVSLRQAGTEEGNISVAGTTVSYNAFTGSHYGWTDERPDFGTLVAMTGVNRRYHGDAASEILYGIAPTRAPNDPKCLGAYLGLLESARPVNDENPHLVMAVGNGEMCVTSEGGAIEPGDYLISSSTRGCAMKHDPAKYPVGHVVARAAEAVDFGKVAPGADGVKRARVSVLFESFARHTEAAALARTVEAQQKEIDELKARLTQLEAALSRRVR